MVPDMSNVFTAPSMVYFQRYLAIQFGLGGWFTSLTPGQLISGYTDSLLEKVKQTPLYYGGDATVSSWISIDNDTPTKPANAPIEMKTGTEDYDDVREIKEWLGEDDKVEVYRLEYDTLYTVEPDTFNPWKSIDFEEELEGTDGLQFEPNLDTIEEDDGEEEREDVDVFVSDLSRVL